MRSLLLLQPVIWLRKRLFLPILSQISLKFSIHIRRLLQIQEFLPMLPMLRGPRASLQMPH